MQSFSLQVRTRCSSCGGALPLNGLVDVLPCPACGERNQFGARFWGDLLGDDPLDEGSSTILMGDWEVAMKTRSADPRCPSCNAAVPVAHLQAHASAGSAPCPACGKPVSVRTPPPPMAASGFVLLVGEDPLQVAAPAGPAIATKPEARPVAFNCPSCAGSLRVDGSTRVVTCTYCDASAYLPDDLWHVFHPVQRARPWYLLATPGARQRGLRESADAATPPERLAILALHLDAEVRENVARNPSTPPETVAALVAADENLGAAALINPGITDALLRTLLPIVSMSALANAVRHDDATAVFLSLAAAEVERRIASGAVPVPANQDAGDGDDDDDDTDVGDALSGLARHPNSSAAVLEMVARLCAGVRTDDGEPVELVLASNPNTPAAVLVSLAAFSDSDVREAVLHNPSAPAEALHVLAGDADASIRVRLAVREQVPETVLLRLADDDDSNVRGAARAHANYPGWFKRLFRREMQ